MDKLLWPQLHFAASLSPCRSSKFDTTFLRIKFYMVDIFTYLVEASVLIKAINGYMFNNTLGLEPQFPTRFWPQTYPISDPTSWRDETVYLFIIMPKPRGDLPVYSRFESNNDTGSIAMVAITCTADHRKDMVTLPAKQHFSFEYCKDFPGVCPNLSTFRNGGRTFWNGTLLPVLPAARRPNNENPIKRSPMFWHGMAVNRHAHACAYRGGGRNQLSPLLLKFEMPHKTELE